MSKRKTRLLILIWLLVVGLASGRLAYAQYCYSDGDGSKGAYVTCDDFSDEECHAYGANIVCEYWQCDTQYCLRGYFMRCRALSDVCSGMNICQGQQCI